MAPMLTAEEARAAFDYDPETGVIRWKIKPKYDIDPGDVAGSRHIMGYVEVGYRGRSYLAHRLAWLITYGTWPVGVTDHRNGVRDDNRIGNLRAASQRANTQNRKIANRNSTTGLLGAAPHGSGFQARIGDGGGARYLGTFLTAEEAHAAYLAAKLEIHEGYVPT